jgi:hypothetical protein
MWIEEVAPQRVAERFQNYQCALGVFGPKGSESGSWKESTQPEKNRMTAAADVEFESVESREHFAQPGEAEWGC